MKCRSALIGSVVSVVMDRPNCFMSVLKAVLPHSRSDKRGSDYFSKLIFFNPQGDSLNQRINASPESGLVK